MAYSREFLEEILRETKKYLPGYLYASLLQSARPRSGGRASHRVEAPDVFAKLALQEMRPNKLRELKDDELSSVWNTLEQWFKNAKRRRQAIENFVNAGVWTKAELERRGKKIKESPFVEAIAELGSTKKISKGMHSRSKCMDCSKSPEIDVIWADGRARAWFCKTCFVIWEKGEEGNGGRDIVGRKEVKNGEVPVKFSDYRPVVKQEREIELRKQALSMSRTSHEQAERAKKADLLTVGEYFYQMRPLRSRDTWNGFNSTKSPFLIQKKYNGLNHQIHKDGDRVVIFSEDGEDNSSRLPKIVKAIKELKVDKLIALAEIEAWNGSSRLPREVVEELLVEKDDSNLVANIYDVLFKDKDIHTHYLRERFKVLKELGGGTMGVPKRRILNFVPGIQASSQKEIEREVEKIRKLAGSEGAIAKSLISYYRIDDTRSRDWAKFNNSAEVRGVVLSSTRRRGGVFLHKFGVRPGAELSANLTDDELVPLGETLETGKSFAIGDRILVGTERIKKQITPDGVSISVSAPQVFGTYEGDPDTVDTLSRRAIDELVLQVKRIDKRGEVEYLPPNALRPELRPEVPSSGPERALVALVGASPDRTEAARREPFTGQAGDILKKVYLEPLGLERSDVFLSNVVPKLLLDDDGKNREPTSSELSDWSDWITKELEESSPQIVIALGRIAEKALGDRRDFVLPHPSAIRKFGDSGEVGRKLKQIKTKLKVQKESKPRDEGGTRASSAFDNWDQNWHKVIPLSGKGRFVYQHHWRGLDEEQTKLSEDKLMKTDHSLHGDLRFEGADGLFGFTVFLGKVEDNRDLKDKDKLMNIKDDQKIEVAPKLFQPKEWIGVGVGKPFVTAPGEIGATSDKWSKFTAEDQGTFEIGVVRQHAIEIFLDGESLKGRYLIQSAPLGGRRRWLIYKPQDQKPSAETRDLADLISELRRKNQKFLFWSKPGERPEKIDVRSGQVSKNRLVAISKADPTKKIIYGVVLDPYGKNGAQEDSHRDWMPPGEIENTAHNYMKGSRVIGLQHGKKANAQVVESSVEQYPSRAEYLKAMRGQAHRVTRRKFGDDFVHSGSWILGVELGDREWDLYQDGKINAFSPGGIGMRRPLIPSEMPRVTFVKPQ